MDDFEKELKIGFLDEAKELLANAEQCFLNLERAQGDPQIIEQIFRLAHNLKGSAGAVGFTELKDFTHKLESVLVKIKNKDLQVNSAMIGLLLECNDFITSTLDLLRSDLSAKHGNPELSAKLDDCLNGNFAVQPEEEKPLEVPAANEIFQTPAALSTALSSALSPNLLTAAETPTNSSTLEGSVSPASPASTAKVKAPADENIRVSLAKIDNLLNIMGELVILQTVMDQQKIHAHSPLMQKTISQMSKIIKEAQALTMGLRMVPLRQTFQKMDRIVRDTSRALNKEIDLSFSGEDTELDKTVIEQLSDPLVHLVRNAVDHGVESTEERLAAGKSPHGKVKLIAFQRGGQIVIEIRDDGKGLDPSKLVKKAIEKGILSAGTNLSAEDAYKLIFAPGFSTKEQITDVSGRGVGMDVVKTNISLLQGEIEIESEIGKGTCFRILLPLTLAIVDGMVVTLSEERYVIPIAQVYESLKPQSENIHSVNEVGEVLHLRGETLPLYRLDKLLKRSLPSRLPATDGIALICKDSNHRSFAILVNDILNQQQVVIKTVGEEIKGFPGITGAAILGDGKASLILDLYELTAPSRKSRNQNSMKESRGIA